MSPLAWAVVIGAPVAAVAVGVTFARCTRKPPRHWDFVEEQWPSPGGWAGRERL